MVRFDLIATLPPIEQFSNIIAIFMKHIDFQSSNDVYLQTRAALINFLYFLQNDNHHKLKQSKCRN
jgi:hypothetical protein